MQIYQKIVSKISFQYQIVKKIKGCTSAGTEYPENTASLCKTLPTPTEIGLNLRDSFNTALAYNACCNTSLVTGLACEGKTLQASWYKLSCATGFFAKWYSIKLVVYVVYNNQRLIYILQSLQLAYCIDPC